MSRLASSLIAKRGLTAWLAFGATGLATGAVWASGFATSTGANRAGGTAASPALAKTAAGDATSALNGKATAVSPLTFDWDGRWGSIDANTVMFKVNLSGSAYAGKDYNVALLVANTSQLTGWASIQLKIDQVQVAPGDPCVAADLTNSADAKVLNVDDQDAGVYWNGLHGDFVYCIGVSLAHGDDPSGTFLRSAQDTPPTSFPSFITTVDRTT